MKKIGILVAVVGVLLSLLVATSFVLTKVRKNKVIVENSTSTITIDEETLLKSQLVDISKAYGTDIVLSVFQSEMPQDVQYFSNVTSTFHLSGKYIVAVYTKSQNTLSYVSTSSIISGQGVITMSGITQESISNNISNIIATGAVASGSNPLEFLDFEGKFMTILTKYVLPIYLFIVSIGVIVGLKKKVN